jgi:hypothetical protein
MTPQAAAAAWKKYMQPFAGKAKLVSPAITDAGAPNGETWMQSFLKECSICTIDAIAIHIYGSPSNEPYFKTYISDGECGVIPAWILSLKLRTAAGKKYNKPIWVTEFAGDNGAGDEVSIHCVSVLRFDSSRCVRPSPNLSRTWFPSSIIWLRSSATYVARSALKS